MIAMPTQQTVLRGMVWSVSDGNDTDLCAEGTYTVSGSQSCSDTTGSTVDYVMEQTMTVMEPKRWFRGPPK